MRLVLYVIARTLKPQELDLQRALIARDICSIDARWTHDKIKMGNISCLRDDGLTWEDFVEANPSCYIAYYEDHTEPGGEIRNRLVELHRSGKRCAYFHPVLGRLRLFIYLFTVHSIWWFYTTLFRLAPFCLVVTSVRRESGAILMQNWLTTIT